MKRFLFTVLFSSSVMAHNVVKVDEVVKHCEGDKLEHKALHSAARKCLELTGFYNPRLKGKLKETLVSGQWGNQNCPYFYFTRIEADYICLNTNEENNYDSCVIECGRKCSDRPVFCGGW
jgi:hypothetical protein